MATDRSELYGYDARNRLRNFERGTLNTAGDDITTPLVDPALPSQQQWTDLDRRGNWLDFSTTLNGQPAVQQTRTVNGVNEVLTLDPDGSGGQSAVTLANDNNGNLTENPWAFNAGDSGTPTGQKYEYDEENRLVRVKRLTSPADQVLLEIGYDAIGRRVESKEYLDVQTGQTSSTPTAVTHHVMLAAMTAEEYVLTEGTASLAREFMWAELFPMPAVMIDWTAAGEVGAGQVEVLHYHRDVLGNVVALTDASGNVVERYRYDAYGMTDIYTGGGALLPASAYRNPFAYTGQRYDAAVGLYHFWFRTYSPSLGRWHQRDPVGYVDGVNLCEYVCSSPLVGWDPLGLFWNELWNTVVSTASGAGAGAVAGAGTGAVVGAGVGVVGGPAVLPAAGAGAVAGGVAGAIGGGVTGLANGIGAWIRGTPVTAGQLAKQSAVNGAISGVGSAIVPGVGAAIGPGAGVGTGLAVTGGIATGGFTAAANAYVNGANPAGVAAAAVWGGTTGGLGGSASLHSAFASGAVHGVAGMGGSIPEGCEQLSDQGQ